MLYFIKVRTKHQKEALQRKRNLRKKTHFFFVLFYSCAIQLVFCITPISGFGRAHYCLSHKESILLFFSFCLEKRLVLTIEPEDYITKTGTGGSIKLYVKGKVEETGQSFATQDVVELTKPTLNVTVSHFDNK